MSGHMSVSIDHALQVLIRHTCIVPTSDKDADADSLNLQDVCPVEVGPFC